MNDFSKMKNSTLVHDYRFESQLCVPQDPIGELEWYPTLDDYSINLDDLWCFCPLDDKDYNGKRMRDERDHALACKKQKIEHDGTEGLKEDWRDESGGDGGKKRRCSHCLAESTPQWRAGPKGPKTLCNACGLRYRSGRLVPEYRPAASPTFDKAKHSNFHKKLLKLGLSE